MPSSLAHYAIGAAVVSLSGLRGRERALVALWAVAPDLDVVTAVPWAFVAPHLPFDGGTLTALAWVLTHRGLSHTVWAAALCGALVWWRARDRRLALASGLAWLSHVALDLLTPWRVAPFWPLTDAAFHVQVVISLDPLLTVASLGATLALLAQTPLADRLPLGPRRRGRALAWGRRWAGRLVVASVLTVPLAAGVMALVAFESDAPFIAVHGAGSPRTMVARVVGPDWVLEERWMPWSQPEVTRVPVVNATSATVDPAPFVEVAGCVLDGLGPYRVIDNVAWTVRTSAEGVHVTAQDVVRNRAGDDGPAVLFDFAQGKSLSVRLGEDEDTLPRPRFTLRVPQAVVEGTGCQ